MTPLPQRSLRESISLDGNSNRADISATHDRVVKTYVTTKAKRLYLRHNSFKELIPIAIAFKAMGITSDKEILQLICGPDERYQEAFGVSLEETAK